MNPYGAARIAWSDLEPMPGPRIDTLRKGDAVRKVVVASTAADTIDRGKRQLTAAVSGQAKRDSYGDIIRVQGWDFERWLKNPVVMWAHEYWNLPVGTGLWIKSEGDELVSRMQFWFGDGAWAEFVGELFEMYASDPPFMRAFSVGFMPIKWEPMYEKNDDGREVFVGYDYLENELWEYSCVPIPAYADALARAVDGGQRPRLARMIEGITNADIAGREPTPEVAARLAGLADLETRLRSLVTGMQGHRAAAHLRAALR